MPRQSFQSTLRLVASSFGRPFQKRRPEPRVDETHRTLQRKAYVQHLEIPEESKVIAYEAPLHGDLIPVDDGFDYYPGPRFWNEGQETVTVHVAAANALTSLNFELTAEHAR